MWCAGYECICLSLGVVLLIIHTIYSTGLVVVVHLLASGPIEAWFSLTNYYVPCRACGGTSGGMPRQLCGTQAKCMRPLSPSVVLLGSVGG